jgi:hypothetical protein
MPAIILSKVLLPQPEGPRIAEKDGAVNEALIDSRIGWLLCEDEI